MDPRSLTDDIIESLLTSPKNIITRRARETRKAKHTERNYVVTSVDGGQSFTLITRQSVMISNSYTAGLIWHSSTSQKVILARYNGSDHPHANPIESEEFEFLCHIHKATQRYIEIGRKSEHYATQTDRYSDLSGAIQCLLVDCNIAGWTSSGSGDVPETEPPQGDFFL